MDKNIIRANNINMFNATQACLVNYNAIINTMPGLQASCLTFTGIMQSINIKMVLVNSSNKGVTLDKHAQRNQMQQLAMIIADRAIGYAGSVNNNELYQTFFQSIRSIARASQSLVITRCQAIAKAAADNLNILQPWNITATEIQALENSIALYVALCNKQTDNATSILIAKREVDSLIAAAKKLLSITIDRGVRSMSSTHPTFAAEYKLARRIINLGHRHTQFKGEAVNKLTNQQISNAEIKFINADKTVETLTDQNGKYREHLNPDIYNIIVTHPSYEPFMIEGIKIHPGEIKVGNFELVPKA